MIFSARRGLLNFRPSTLLWRNRDLGNTRASSCSDPPQAKYFKGYSMTRQENTSTSVMSLEQAAALFPKPEDVDFSYGTAGFRAKAELLDSTVFRMGVLAALRSLHSGQCTGIMMTASHNPVEDNGVKLADPEGGMLTITWEAHATALANAVDAADVCKVVEEIKQKEGFKNLSSEGGCVLVARDTRPSGERLVKAALQGILSITGVKPQNFEILTTPQLHWLVRAANKGLPFTENAYFETLSSSFQALFQLMPQTSQFSTAEGMKMPLLVDGACGVGALKMASLSHIVKPYGLNIELRNYPGDGGVLNEKMGADFVQKEQTAPKTFDVATDIGNRCVSLDGDADRLVYFYFSSHLSNFNFHLLDGDKIAVLAASFIGDQLEVLKKKKENPDRMETSNMIEELFILGFGTVRVGVIQTAYANGASTAFIKKKLGLEVVRTLTGVKYLHEAALDYDIGIYFEANGHGTVIFGTKFLDWLKKESTSEEDGDSERLYAIKRLVAMSEMVNQAVGDALSGILLVETVLRYKGWTVEDWNNLYKDLPSRQLKVKVADRSAIVTTDQETRVASPEGLQKVIDIEIVKHSQGRAFVRPSGTEDAVRIYAEASNQESADTLAQDIASHLLQVLNSSG